MGDCRCDARLTSGDWVGAADDECKGQKARRPETGHVLHSVVSPRQASAATASASVDPTSPAIFELGNVVAARAARD